MLSFIVLKNDSDRHYPPNVQFFAVGDLGVQSHTAPNEENR
jgi:hypothetical protein